LFQPGQKYGFYNVNDGVHDLSTVDWTKEVLKKKASHTFVLGHVPAFSALTSDFGEHPKSFASKENRDEFIKLLVENNVDAYFAGHKHIIYAQVENGTKFFTVGEGRASLYGPITGGYGINMGEGPDYKGVTSDSEFDHGGWASGYHYNLHFPAGALSIFAYMIVTVDGDEVSYELVVPHSFEVKYVKGNDGISPEAVAIVANRTPYERTFKGLTFLMPFSANGYEVSGTYVDWGRNVKPAKKPPKILEVKKINDYMVKVRVEVTVPGADSVDVMVKTK